MILAEVSRADVPMWETVAYTDIIQGIIILVVAIPLIKLLTSFIKRSLEKRLSAHHIFWIQKCIFYPGLILAFITALMEFGFNLTAILGAAGVLSVAFGFAAKTSLSNVISGFFLFAEKPFEVGDMILVNGTRGFVISIDLLSVKLRTLDNLYVRVPNESLIRGEITNITHFPIRRMDLNISVAYKEDLKKVIEILKDLADQNPHSLCNPEPLVVVKEFGASSVDIHFGLWFEKTNFLKLKNSIMIEVKEKFKEENIEIPFPHMTVYAGSESIPFSVESVESVHKTNSGS